MNKIMTITKYDLSQILLKDPVPFDYFIRTTLNGDTDDKSTWMFRTSLIRPIPLHNGSKSEREYFFKETPYVAGEAGFIAIKDSSDKCLQYYLENVASTPAAVSSIA